MRGFSAANWPGWIRSFAPRPRSDYVGTPRFEYFWLLPLLEGRYTEASGCFPLCSIGLGCEWTWPAWRSVASWSQSCRSVATSGSRWPQSGSKRASRSTPISRASSTSGAPIHPCPKKRGSQRLGSFVVASGRPGVRRERCPTGVAADVVLAYARNHAAERR
jgi:hypothetical protein